MNWILELDRELLIKLNSLHAAWLDPIMFFITKTISWLPLYLFLLYLSIKNFKKETWMILIGIGITILLADQITSSFMKPYFARLRPSQEPSLQNILHFVNNYKGGMYGFASGHAANTFGTATFFVLLFKNRYSAIKWLFVWAVVMTYTRIYLGVHYPGDILVGAAIGIACGWFGYLIVQRLQLRWGSTLAKNESQHD